MRNLLFFFFGLLPFIAFSQNQQGYIYVMDMTADGQEIYYVSPFLECAFAGDHDGIDAKRNSLDDQYKAYVEEHFELIEFQTVYSDWFEPGRGVYPETNYKKALENLPVMRVGCQVILVEEFEIDCLEE